MDSEKDPSGSENLKTSVDNEESAPKESSDEEGPYHSTKAREFDRKRRVEIQRIAALERRKRQDENLRRQEEEIAAKLMAIDKGTQQKNVMGTTEKEEPYHRTESREYDRKRRIEMQRIAALERRKRRDENLRRQEEEIAAKLMKKN